MFTRRSLLWVLPALLLAGCAAEQSEPVAEETASSEMKESYALCAPISEDQLNNWNAMIEEMKVRQNAHVTANASVGIDKEMVWLQQTPEGTAAVVYFEGEDLAGMMSRRSAAQDEHTQWFVSQIKSIHGLPEDISDMPTNEMIFKGEVDGIEGETQPVAIAVPVLPGKLDVHLQMVAEMSGARHDAYLKSRRARGISKEYAWHQTAPDGSVWAVVYIQVTDPANLSTPPTTEFENWFRDNLAEIHGIPKDAPLPANTLVASF